MDTLIVGDTRVSKTRLFDLLIAQAIARGEPVIIIDPRGITATENARGSVNHFGRGDRFIYFHPLHPEVGLH